jgi:peptidoglycan/LPS O-acetylase OafA/YrhL
MRARTDHGYVYLDLVRGLAALAVFAAHLRNFLFDDFSGSPKTHPLYTIFYFLTGFGHQSVVTVFVLSGFLIAAFLAAGLMRGKRMPPGIDVLALYLALFLSILADARGIYLLFEKQTGRVKKALLRTGGVADPCPAHGSL